MHRRIVICPVIRTTIMIAGGPSRPFLQPKIETIIDPGGVATSGVDDDGNPVTLPVFYLSEEPLIQVGGLPWCLVIAYGNDMSALDSDPEVEDLLEGDDLDLAATPASLGWDAAKLRRVSDRMTAKGVYVTGLGADEALGDIVLRVARHLSPNRTSYSPRRRL